MKPSSMTVAAPVPGKVTGTHEYRSVKLHMVKDVQLSAFRQASRARE